jgi:hypothetical protein
LHFSSDQEWLTANMLCFASKRMTQT